MKNISLLRFVKDYVEDEYAMNVFYQSIKKQFAENDFSLADLSSFFIDGRFLGETLSITFKAKYKTRRLSLALLLSLRLLAHNHKYIQLCEDDSLILPSRPRESFQWVEFMSIILDNWDDDEVKMLYDLLEEAYYDEEPTDEEIEEFLQSIVIPGYKNEKAYYQAVAEKTNGVANGVIGNNAFVDADIKRYVVGKDINYIGNTVFSYCGKLETLVFEGKVLFGVFPIIECTQLKQIVVPIELLGYYQDSLPCYKDIITEKEGNIEDVVVSERNEEHRIDSKKGVQRPLDEVDDLGIEHVYVDLPSADPYTEYEVEHEAKPIVLVQEGEKKPIDINKFQTVFDKKATSYKYFWLMAIISLAKEKKSLTISYKDIVIRMAAMAWPIVFDDEIDLGSRDMMYKYLDEVVKETTLIRTASSNVVENYLLQHYSSHGIDKILSPLLKNVPYRFLSPWIKFTTTEDVIEKSLKTNFDGLYAIHTNGITLSEEWWEYIRDNYLEICDLTMRSFISYAKQYNNDMKLLKLMTTGWSLVKSNK